MMCYPFQTDFFAGTEQYLQLPVALYSVGRASLEYPLCLVRGDADVPIIELIPATAADTTPKG